MIDAVSHEDAPAAQATSGESNAEFEKRKLFMKYVTEGRKLVEEGDIPRAIELNEKALAIKNSEKLQKRIEKMKVSTLFGLKVVRCLMHTGSINSIHF